MTAYEDLRTKLAGEPKVWLITGAAGFIGSHLTETLLKLDQRVVGLDNFATGHRINLERVRELVTPLQWTRLRFLEADTRDPAACRDACTGVDYVLHQAALGSVPRSIADPASTHTANVDGFLNILIASREAGVRRMVYASSSSLYGDHPELPKIEDRIGKPLSPYALTKRINEEYSDVFARTYGFDSVGLRYFNIFGARQDPAGAYAAVIPKWAASMIRGEDVFINGDGETSRDFCYIANAVQANLLAATSEHPEAGNQVFNVAVGYRTTLNQLFEAIRNCLLPRFPHVARIAPIYRDQRPGDVRHSLADIGRIGRILGYEPKYKIDNGLQEAIGWYAANIAATDS